MPLFAFVVEWKSAAVLLGVISCVVGLGLCLRLLTLRRSSVEPGKTVRLGFVSLPALAFYKIVALLCFLVVPPTTVGLAGYHLFEGVKETESCMNCHVMHPMGNDLHDPESNTLAARHYRNKWIPDKQCYHCHTDYGMNGTMAAKMEGFRHLARYTTETYQEPIRYKGKFENQNCLYCHAKTPKFEAVTSHHTVGERLEKSEASCLNCHGGAHPSREQRTPGNKEYDRLMNEVGPFRRRGGQ